MKSFIVFLGIVSAGWACGVAAGQGMAAAGPAPLRGDVFIHDPSTIVKCQDEYWLFATGPGVISRHSKDRVTWQTGPRVFSRPPAWTAEVVPEHRGYFWAPDLIEVGGQFLLYYSVSQWGKKTSAIGLAVNPTLDPLDPRFQWTDHGIVIQSGDADEFNAIDPCVVRDEQKGLWLCFGSFWSGIKLIELDPATGKRISPASPVYALAYHESIEAPALCRHDGYYYLFVNWGLCCLGTNSTYNIRVGRSQTITGPYFDRDGKNLLESGGTLVLDSSGSAIGPGHAGFFSAAGANFLSYHYYDANRRGRATLAIQPLIWGPGGWPAVPDSPSPTTNHIRWTDKPGAE
jgi:arabinan endo-1,5-alpha-L-arabinosidase